MSSSYSLTSPLTSFTTSIDLKNGRNCNLLQADKPLLTTLVPLEDISTCKLVLPQRVDHKANSGLYICTMT